MAGIHHYGCHPPLNKIWSNIYIYFILVQIRTCSQTWGNSNSNSNRKLYTYVCNSNSHGKGTIFIQRQIVIVME